MWISKARWNELKGRVDSLERQQRALSDKTVGIAVWRCERPTSQWDRPEYVSYTEAIMKILHHLGLELKWHEGTPSGTDLVERSKAKR